jgi:hypothetical protein
MIASVDVSRRHDVNGVDERIPANPNDLAVKTFP